MDNSIGPSLPFGPFERPREGREGNKKDPYSEALHQLAHEFSLDLIRARNSHSKTLQHLGVIMFVAEAGVLTKEMAEKVHDQLIKIRENFYYSSLKNSQIADELEHTVHQIKSSKPQAKIIAMVEELFYLLVKTPKEGVPPINLDTFESLMRPIEDKVFDSRTSNLHISHIAKRLDEIESDLQSHPKELGAHCLKQLENLSKEVQNNF